MNKKIIVLSATVFGFVGSYLPTLFGNNDFFSGWSILGSLVGGIFGIWVGVWAANRWG
jgi:hypothetical protein